jgi:hypothetical protein
MEKDGKGANAQMVEVVVDQGVSDKRLFVRQVMVGCVRPNHGASVPYRPLTSILMRRRLRFVSSPSSTMRRLSGSARS